MQLPVSSWVLLVVPPVVLFLIALVWWLTGPRGDRRVGNAEGRLFPNPQRESPED